MGGFLANLPSPVRVVLMLIVVVLLLIVFVGAFPALMAVAIPGVIIYGLYLVWRDLSGDGR